MIDGASVFTSREPGISDSVTLGRESRPKTTILAIILFIYKILQDTTVARTGGDLMFIWN